MHMSRGADFYRSRRLGRWPRTLTLAGIIGALASTSGAQGRLSLTGSRDLAKGRYPSKGNLCTLPWAIMSPWAHARAMVTIRRDHPFCRSLRWTQEALALRIAKRQCGTATGISQIGWSSASIGKSMGKGPKTKLRMERPRRNAKLGRHDIWRGVLIYESRPDIVHAGQSYSNSTYSQLFG